MQTTKPSETPVAPGIVRRTDRGLCVAGTRISLYLIMDYLKAGWPPHLARHFLGLSEEQMNRVTAYIEKNRAEFEAEYEEVVLKAEERERYWRERERQRRAEMEAKGLIKPRVFTPEQAAAWARLQALKQEGKF